MELFESGITNPEPVSRKLQISYAEQRSTAAAANILTSLGDFFHAPRD